MKTSIFFFAQTAEEITHFVTGIDTGYGGFLKSHRSDF